MKAKHLSTEARKACKALHFSPTDFEVVNSGRPALAERPEDEEYVVLRCWNSRRSVELTNHDLSYAHNYL